MRASADRNDPDYTEFACYGRVTLDGELLKTCVTADEEQGLVVCFKKPYEVVDGWLATEEKRGVVVITWEDLPPGLTVEDILKLRKK